MKLADFGSLLRRGEATKTGYWLEVMTAEAVNCYSLFEKQNHILLFLDVKKNQSLLIELWLDEER